MLLLLVATNASALLIIFTRFTLELFSVLLSIVFIGFVIVKFWDIHHKYSHSNLFYSSFDWDCDCYRAVSTNTSQWELVGADNCTEEDGLEVKWIGDGCDVFFLSIILMLGTFLVAVFIQKFYRTPFFTSLVSQWNDILII